MTKDEAEKIAKDKKEPSRAIKGLEKLSDDQIRLLVQNNIMIVESDKDYFTGAKGRSSTVTVKEGGREIKVISSHYLAEALLMGMFDDVVADINLHENEELLALLDGFDTGAAHKIGVAAERGKRIEFEIKLAAKRGDIGYLDRLKSFDDIKKEMDAAFAAMAVKYEKDRKKMQKINAVKDVLYARANAVDVLKADALRTIAAEKAPEPVEAVRDYLNSERLEKFIALKVDHIDPNDYPEFMAEEDIKQEIMKEIGKAVKSLEVSDGEIRIECVDGSVVTREFAFSYGMGNEAAHVEKEPVSSGAGGVVAKLPATAVGAVDIREKKDELALITNYIDQLGKENDIPLDLIEKYAQMLSAGKSPEAIKEWMTTERHILSEQIRRRDEYDEYGLNDILNKVTDALKEALEIVKAEETLRQHFVSELRAKELILPLADTQVIAQAPVVAAPAPATPVVAQTPMAPAVAIPAAQIARDAVADNFGALIDKYPALLNPMLETPQGGNNHNEGPTVRDHLNLMIAYLSGDEAHPKFGGLVTKFKQSVPKEVQDILAANRDAVLKFILFHDVAKANTWKIMVKDMGALFSVLDKLGIKSKVTVGGSAADTTADKVITNDKGEYGFKRKDEKGNEKFEKAQYVTVDLGQYNQVFGGAGAELIKTVSYPNHDAKGAEALAGIADAQDIIGLIKYHMAFSKSVKPTDIAPMEAEQVNIPLLIALGYLDGASSIKADGTFELEKIEEMKTSYDTYTGIFKPLKAFLAEKKVSIDDKKLAQVVDEVAKVVKERDQGKAPDEAQFVKKVSQMGIKGLPALGDMLGAVTKPAAPAAAGFHKGAGKEQGELYLPELLKAAQGKKLSDAMNDAIRREAGLLGIDPNTVQFHSVPRSALKGEKDVFGKSAYWHKGAGTVHIFFADDIAPEYMAANARFEMRKALLGEVHTAAMEWTLIQEDIENYLKNDDIPGLEQLAKEWEWASKKEEYKRILMSSGLSDDQADKAWVKGVENAKRAQELALLALKVHRLKEKLEKMRPENPNAARAKEIIINRIKTGKLPLIMSVIARGIEDFPMDASRKDTVIDLILDDGFDPATLSAMYGKLVLLEKTLGAFLPGYADLEPPAQGNIHTAAALEGQMFKPSKGETKEAKLANKEIVIEHFEKLDDLQRRVHAARLVKGALNAMRGNADKKILVGEDNGDIEGAVSALLTDKEFINTLSEEEKGLLNMAKLKEKLIFVGKGADGKILARQMKAEAKKLIGDNYKMTGANIPAVYYGEYQDLEGLEGVAVLILSLNGKLELVDLEKLKAAATKENRTLINQIAEMVKEHRIRDIVDDGAATRTDASMETFTSLGFQA